MEMGAQIYRKVGLLDLPLKKLFVLFTDEKRNKKIVVLVAAQTSKGVLHIGLLRLFLRFKD